ncbi:MAG: hypothetical protein EBX50_22445 [Chitinophagia bacterium]|nr:hypothetical protein [Chitinophagia bacterium]
MKTHLKKYFAELLGTFSLSLAVVVAVHAGGPISVPLVAGLTLGLFVYSLGHISGAHFNPAVTLGAWTIGKIKHHDVFTFGIAAVVYGKTPSVVSGIAIGASLVLGVVVASSLGSNGVLNPAVAMALGSFNLMYLIGPIIGSVLGMNVYKIFTE